jgi:hypothetical protein
MIGPKRDPKTTGRRGQRAEDESRWYVISNDAKERGPYVTGANARKRAERAAKKRSR